MTREEAIEVLARQPIFNGTSRLPRMWDVQKSSNGITLSVVNYPAMWFPLNEAKELVEVLTANIVTSGE